jgi:uncharacterized protein (TIGR00369 family)
MKAFDPAALFFGAAIPMAASLGVREGELAPDRVTARLPYRADLTNSAGNVHGGAMMALFDCLLAAAARSHDPAGMRAITVDLTTHFVASTRGELFGEARCLRRGSLAFSQGELRDADGRLLATATGTFKLMKRETVHDR